MPEPRDCILQVLLHQLCGMVLDYWKLVNQLGHPADGSSQTVSPFSLHSLIQSEYMYTGLLFATFLLLWSLKELEGNIWMEIILIILCVIPLAYRLWLMINLLWQICEYITHLYVFQLVRLGRVDTFLSQTIDFLHWLSYMKVNQGSKFHIYITFCVYYMYSQICLKDHLYKG